MIFDCFCFAISTKLQYLGDKLLCRLFLNEAIQNLKNAYWNIVTHYLISPITSGKLKGFVTFIFLNKCELFLFDTSRIIIESLSNSTKFTSRPTIYLKHVLVKKIEIEHVLSEHMSS